MRNSDVEEIDHHFASHGATDISAHHGAEKTLSTKRFKTPGAKVTRALFLRHGGGWAASVGSMMMTAVLLAVVIDLRFLIVALMILFIFAPMSAAFIYFNHGLRPATALNATEHSVAISPTHLLITLSPHDEDSKPRSVEIPLSDLKPYTVGLSEIFLPAGGSPDRGFLIIPLEAFDAPGDLQIFADTLASRCGWNMPSDITGTPGGHETEHISRNEAV